MGVNDLVKEWERRQWVGDLSEAVEDLEEIARTAWHPVSEPPTEADGDSFGEVLISDGKVVHMEPWDLSQEWKRPGTKWARVKDVVLMPPQGGE